MALANVLLVSCSIFLVYLFRNLCISFKSPFQVLCTRSHAICRVFGRYYNMLRKVALPYTALPTADTECIIRGLLYTHQQTPRRLGDTK